MKQCSKCNKEKVTELFGKSSKSRDGLHSWCKQCVSEARMKRYYENHTEERTRGNKRNKEAYEINQLKLINFLRLNPCVDCGEDDWVVLEFDHIDPSKKVDSVRILANRVYRWDKIQSEIDKCEIRCSNCHKKKTAKQFGYYKYV